MDAYLRPSLRILSMYGLVWMESLCLIPVQAGP